LQWTAPNNRVVEEEPLEANNIHHL
jgi:hypothetical protein